MAGTVRIEKCPNQAAAKRRADALAALGFSAIRTYQDSIFAVNSSVDTDGVVTADDPTTVTSPFIVVAMKP